MAMSDDDDDLAQLDHQNEHDHPVVGQFVPERPPPPVAIQSLSGINTIGGDHQTVENGNQHQHQPHHQAVLRPKTTSIAGGNRQQTINFDEQPEQPPKNRAVQKEEAAKQQQGGGGPSVEGGQPMVVKSTTTNSSSKMRYKAIEQRNQQKVRAIKHTVVVPTVKPVATKPVRAAPPPPPPHKVASFPLAVRGRDPLQNVSKNTATEGQQQNVIIRKPPPATTVGHPNAGKHPTRAHGIVATNKAPVASNKGGEKRDHQNLPPPTRQNQQQQNKIILLSDDDYEAEEAEEQLGIRRAIYDDDSIVETVLKRRRGLGRQTANSYFFPFDENIGGDGGRYQTNREANLAAERNLRRFLTRSRARVQAIVDASRKRATIAAHRRAVITDLLKGKRVVDDEVMSVLCTDSSKVLAFPSFMDRMRRASKRAYDKSPVRQKQEEERERALQGATNRIMAHSSAAITRMLAKAQPNRRPKFLHRSPTRRQKQEAEHEHALQRATNRIMAHSSSVINQMLAKAHLTNKHNGDDDQ